MWFYCYVPRYLSVALEKDKVSECGFRALSHLLDLRVFLFADFDRMGRDPNTELSQVFTCVQMMPQLHLVGREFDLYECMMGKYLFGYHNELVMLQRPVRLELQELVLSGKSVRLPKNFQVPEVRRLHLYQPAEVDLRSLLRRMPHLSELGLWKVSSAVLSQILGEVGSRLDKLQVLSTEPVQLGRVFECCPRLSELRVVQSEVVCTPMPLTAALARLRLLEVSQIAGKYCLLPTGLLLRLLSAPMLEDVYLGSFWLTADDLEPLQRLLMDRAVLQQLDSFECDTNNDELLTQLLTLHVEAFCPLKKQPETFTGTHMVSYIIKTMREIGIF